jgi:ubiquinone/menaquinone biosynthesis C-methylase UbiE
MTRGQEIPESERLKREYYDLVGDWNLPIVRMGGLADTDRLLQMCAVDENSRVLEVGCGVGYTACEIARKYGAQVVGIDMSQNMIANARKRAQDLHLEDVVEFRVGDVTGLPFDDGTFDVVIMESFLNILGEPELIERALHEISRVTKPGGCVGANEVFVDASAPSEVRDRLRESLRGVYGPGANLARYSDEEFKKWFEDAGLPVIQMVKKPAAGMRSQLVKDLVQVMGLGGFVRYSFRAAKDMLLNSELRKAAMKAAPAQRLMERNKDTRDFFGYVLMVAEKPS